MPMYFERFAHLVTLTQNGVRKFYFSFTDSMSYLSARKNFRDLVVGSWSFKKKTQAQEKG